MARTPLHQAAVRGSEATVRSLIDEGFDVNEADFEGLTPLHMACINGNFAAASVLLESGALVDPQDKWGNTPLNRAVFEDEAADLVRLLVDRGADPTIENNYGHSPLSEVRRYRNAEYLAILSRDGGVTSGEEL